MEQKIRFGLVLGHLAISSIKLKYSTFEGSFFYVLMGKTNDKIDFLYVAVSAIKSCIFLHNDFVPVPLVLFTKLSLHNN